MGLIPEGNILARALKGEYGEDEKGYETARIDFEIIAGPSAGSRITYNGRVDARSAPYVQQDMKAAGWSGNLDKDAIPTLAADIAAKPVEVPIEIQHKQTKDGSRTFAVVRSIGRGQKPLSKPSSQNAEDRRRMFGATAAPTETDEAPF